MPTAECAPRPGALGRRRGRAGRRALGSGARARGGAAVGAAEPARRGRGAPCSRVPAGRVGPSPRPRPPGRLRSLPSSPLGTAADPRQARVGGRWVSAEKVNEDGGAAASASLGRQSPERSPPAPWTRRTHWRPSPPPGKRVLEKGGHSSPRGTEYLGRQGLALVTVAGLARVHFP